MSSDCWLDCLLLCLLLSLLLFALKFLSFIITCMYMNSFINYFNFCYSIMSVSISLPLYIFLNSHTHLILCHVWKCVRIFFKTSDFPSQYQQQRLMYLYTSQCQPLFDLDDNEMVMHLQWYFLIDGLIVNAMGIHIMFIEIIASN